MPKRIVDGDALWTSDKLAQVEPVDFRAEYANLLPLAMANGTFECEPKKVWHRVYAYNRPDVTPENVEAILDEFERVKMLFRWRAQDGKTWGHWVGSDKPGRLPAASQIKKGEKVGASVPTAQLQEFLTGSSRRGGSKDSPRSPLGDPKHGFGFGSGMGIGIGSVPANAGGAGGVAPASEGRSNGEGEESVAGMEIAPDAISSFEDRADIHPADTTGGAGGLAPASGGKRTGTVGMAIPESEKKSPSPVQQEAAPVPDEAFDALNFAFEREGPFAGYDPVTLRRIVFYHWKIAKAYWSLPEAKVDSPARLEKVLTTMAKQVPQDFRVPGSATLVLPCADASCSRCGGSGHVPDRSDAYEGELSYMQANPCSCVTFNSRPWRGWKKEADAA